MPLPTPKKGENKDEFIDRCMGDKTARKEYPDGKQRRAVCEGQWDDKNGGNQSGSDHSGGYPCIIEALNTYQWAIMPEWLDTIHEVVAARLDGKLSAEEIRERIGDVESSRIGSYDVGATRVIPVHGVISKRMPMFSSISGGTSSAEIKRDILDALEDADVENILLDIDSPGGTADGPGDLSDFIYAARGRKSIRALADGMAASAAYYIGSAADEFWTTQSAQVGSIGVISAHYDYSEAYKRAGVKKTYLTAGKYKAIGNETEPLTKEARDYIQERLDFIYTAFVDAVARNRGVDAKTVLTDMADGRIFIGAQAVDAGLADRVATFDEAVAFNESGSVGSVEINGPFGGAQGKHVGANNYSPVQSKNNDQEETIMPEITKDKLEKEHPELVQEIRDGAVAAAKDDLIGEGVAKERKRVTEILEAEGDEQVTLQAIKDGTRASDTFKALFKAEKQKRADGLDEMRSDAPESAGLETPKEPEKTDTRPADEIVAERAGMLATEKGISFVDATEQVLKADPKLAEAYSRIGA